MQIRRLNGGRLAGIKAILKATPERVYYSDRDGTRHNSVAYILSLEIGATDLRTLVSNMTEPVRVLGEGRANLNLPPGVQYVARETDAERAREIAGEFYPDGDTACEEVKECSVGQSEKDEQLARICELGRRLGFNDAKTRMLIGQSASDLAGLERKLLNKLDDQPHRMPPEIDDKANSRRPKEVGRANEVMSSNRSAGSEPNVSRPLSEDSPSESFARGCFE